MSNATLTKDRVCTVLREKLYSMADNENQAEYKPLQLKWVLPVESTQGLISLYENIISILDYVQKNECNRDTIDKIIENDMRPITSGIRDEYDFFIAGTIMALCSIVDDYSDEKELMRLVHEILGKFIILLEEAWKLFVSDSKEDNESNDTQRANSIIEQEVDTTNIEEGMFLPKGYKELCALLHENPLKSGSNSYKAQLKRWARYFKMEKGRGRSLVILDIYDEPLPNDDGRKNGNRNIYLKYIETILLKYIYYRQGQVCYTTRNQLWLLLGMINNNYKKIPLKILKAEIEYCDVTEWELNKFYMRCNTRLNTILFSALNNLQNRSLIAFETQIMIVVPDSEKKGFSKHYVADENEIRKILAVERNILNIMGYESKNHAACCMKLSEFYEKVNQKLFDLYGWERKYERLKIIFNEGDIKDAITKNEYELQRMYLNEIIIDAIDKNAQTVVDNRMKKALLEYDEYLEGWKENNWGIPPKIEDLKDEIFTYPKYFVNIQRRLSKKFLVIKSKVNNDNREELDKELDELFANLGTD